MDSGRLQFIIIEQVKHFIRGDIPSGSAIRHSRFMYPAYRYYSMYKRDLLIYRIQLTLMFSEVIRHPPHVTVWYNPPKHNLHF